MTSTTSAEHSLWLDLPEHRGYPPLQGDLKVDVAVIGGGIAGLTAALLIKRTGATVAVLEANRVGTGVTGCTTAKVSALQGTVYSTITSRHGADTAAVYAEASRAGVEQLAAIAAAEQIECDLERRPAVTFAAAAGQVRKMEREAAAAARAGLAVDTDGLPDLPCPVFGAVTLADQVQLHPVRYVRGLAAAVDDGSSHVLEQTRVVRVEEGQPCCVHTEHGVVTADHVVVATHYPILDRGGYFARLVPQRSYCVAARLRSGSPSRAMAISAGSPTRSVRSYGDVLVVGGEGHSPGARRATQERFDALAEFARQYWDVADVTHRWSAQDPTPYDHLPMIGPYRPGSGRLWVATGFMKWGLATATFGAAILADLIDGRDDAWASTFSPSRLSLRSLHEIGKLGAKFSADLVYDRVRPPEAFRSTEIPRGEARVVADGLGKKGVYVDASGTSHAVSLRCTHMGCLLRFNAAERSWDCPCHGSRFDVDGAVLEGPAVSPLPRRDP